ncbi:MAG TPA: cytochrome b/b6 domain-containing protein [Acetobacteraceae bacterium]|jgi:cytochrome b561
MPYRYSTAARWFHWITVALLLVLATIGIWGTSFAPKDEALKDLLFDIHESTGVALFVIVALHVLRRLANPLAPLPPRLPRTVRLAARTNHALLLVVQPVIGFLDTNAWGFPVTWARLVPIPSPIGHEKLSPRFCRRRMSGVRSYWRRWSLRISAASRITD